MVVRSRGGTLVVQARQRRGHNSGQGESDLETLIRSAAVELWPIGQVRRRARNPRHHSSRKLAALRRAIATYGVFVPLVLDQNGNLLSGEARLACAIELGLSMVPVIVVTHLSETEKRLFALAENRIPELSTWDLPALKLEISELPLADPTLDLTSTGFDTADLDRILNSAASDALGTDDILPDLESRAVARVGDLFVLRDHRFYCGSAQDPQSYEALLRGELAQMVITDPPYNVPIAGHARNSRTTHREFVEASGEMTEQEFTEFLSGFIRHVKCFSSDGAIIYIFMDHAHSLELQAAAYPLLGKQKQLCVWVKDNAGMGSFYRSAHELIYVYKKGTAPHLNHFNLGEKGRYRTSVWNYPGANSGHDRKGALAMHPTVKPCAMFVDAMLDCSDRNGIVLDCFGGSGVTIIAAERTVRRARVIELDPRYVDLSIRRWQTMTGEKAIHAESGLSFEELSTRRGEK